VRANTATRASGALASPRPGVVRIGLVESSLIDLDRESAPLCVARQATSALRYGLGVVLVLPTLLDETAHLHAEQVLGIPFDAIIDLSADITARLDRESLAALLHRLERIGADLFSVDRTR
jgi:hypothetical protein